MGFVYVDAVTRVRRPVSKDERYNIVKEISGFSLSLWRSSKDGWKFDNYLREPSHLCTEKGRLLLSSKAIQKD